MRRRPALHHAASAARPRRPRAGPVRSSRSEPEQQRRFLEWRPASSAAARAGGWRGAAGHPARAAHASSGGRLRLTRSSRTARSLLHLPRLPAACGAGRAAAPLLRFRRPWRGCSPPSRLPFCAQSSPSSRCSLTACWPERARPQESTGRRRAASASRRPSSTCRSSAAAGDGLARRLPRQGRGAQLLGLVVRALPSGVAAARALAAADSQSGAARCSASTCLDVTRDARDFVARVRPDLPDAARRRRRRARATSASSAIPETFVIDRRGRIAADRSAARSTTKFMREHVTPLLKERA